MEGLLLPGAGNPALLHAVITRLILASLNNVEIPETLFSVRTLQRKNAENWKQIFPEKEYRGLSPNFHIHVSVSHLYISTIGLPIPLEICIPILGLYKQLSDT
jgi:hypothetical protein